MAADAQLKFTNIAIIWKRLAQNGQNLAEIIYYLPAIRKYCQNFKFFKSKMAAGRHFVKHKKLNNSENIWPIITKF